MATDPLIVAFDEAVRATGVDRYCAACGGLGAESAGVVIVEGDDEPRRCAGCGLMLDASGHALGILVDGEPVQILVRGRA